MTHYNGLALTLKEESENYKKISKLVTDEIKYIFTEVTKHNNTIVLNTNLKRGLPMENINKIAGPVVEAWAQEVFMELLEENAYEIPHHLIKITECERLHMADIILHFDFSDQGIKEIVNVYVDSKATSQDIKNSGKSPNITSFERIRNAYNIDPDYLFIILSLKQKVYTQEEKCDLCKTHMQGAMEIVDTSVYDLKYIAGQDISYNPALGTGQLQVRDIHYVNQVDKTTKAFCQLLDQKYINSKKGYEQWLVLAEKNKWYV